MKPKLNIASLSAQVDELGYLLAEISALTKKADAIKDVLKGSGLHDLDGQLFHAVVVEQERTSLDSAAVKALLSPEALAKVTKTTAVKAVKVTARLAAAA